MDLCPFIDHLQPQLFQGSQPRVEADVVARGPFASAGPFLVVIVGFALVAVLRQRERFRQRAAAQTAGQDSCSLE